LDQDIGHTTRFEVTKERSADKI